MAKKKTKKAPARKAKHPKHLGDFAISRLKFDHLDAVFKEFRTEEFKNLTEMQKSERVGRVLLKLIQAEPKPGFLLGAVSDYIDRVNHEKVLDAYSFSNFELWLNQFSGLSEEENYKVRAQIAGKYIPREEYQIYFPIGMGKKYGGTHYVTAHGSPDLDTTIASFWGWVDAFAARVAEGLHLWNIPGGSPPPQIETSLLFHNIFGENFFSHFAKGRAALSLSSLDLLSQKGVIKKQTEESSLNIDQERTHHCVVLIDERGFYLGDWRSIDVEGVRQVIMLLSQVLRWFENFLHVELITLFAKENLTRKDFPHFFRKVFGTRLEQAQPAKQLTEKQRANLQDYLVKVLKVKNGLESTFEEFSHAMKEISLFAFHEFVDLTVSIEKSPLFDKAGYILENRPRIFHVLEKLIRGLDNAIQSIGAYVEKLDVALKIKTDVFGHIPQVLSSRADIEEIRSKMASYSYLTVTSTDQEGRHIPLGVVHSSDLHKPILGTVSLRDFCNREETKIPSYLEVISVIDHHKSTMNTFSPPVAVIADAQSSNALVAALAFEINDRYSTGGMSAKEIEAQMKEVKTDLSKPRNKRIFQRLLQKGLVAQNKNRFFIDPQREIIEYLHFLYAILDDTDLLTKVSLRDLECVASLLNRLKSLFLGKEVEILSFDDIPQNGDYVTTCVRRVLQNIDTYSLYRKIYLAKEAAVEENLELCIQGKPSSIFLDTKEQNGCCRVGQTKLFAKNIATFEKHIDRLRKIWYHEAEQAFKEKSEVDLHIHMISTISGAEDLFAGAEGEYDHQDEIWFWIPEREQAIEHLKTFLNAFRALPQVAKNRMEVEFLGENAHELERIFTESFLPIPKTRAKKTTLPIAVLKFDAGTINSRKALVSPCLPRLG